MLALLFYPAAAAPVILAYLAEYAFDSSAAFFGVILLDLAFAAAVYWISLESATARASARREQFVHDLSQAGGPVSG